MTFTNKCLSYTSRVGVISKGKIFSNKGLAPNSLEFAVSCLKADFLIYGFPFLIFNNNVIIFLSFIYSVFNYFSSTSVNSMPKLLISSGFRAGRPVEPGVCGIS